MGSARRDVHLAEERQAGELLELVLGADGRAQVLDEHDQDHRPDEGGQRRHADDEHFWGAIESIGATAKSTTESWPSGRLTPREASSEISSASLFASAPPSPGLVPWTRIDRNRVVSLAVTRVAALRSVAVIVARASAMADSSSGVVVTSSRVRLDEGAGRAQGLAIRVVRADEQLRLRLVRRRDRRSRPRAGHARDPCRHEQRPPPTSRDREVASQFHSTPLGEHPCPSWADRRQGYRFGCEPDQMAYDSVRSGTERARSRSTGSASCEPVAGADDERPRDRHDRDDPHRLLEIIRHEVHAVDEDDQHGDDRRDEAQQEPGRADDRPIHEGELRHQERHGDEDGDGEQEQLDVLHRADPERPPRPVPRHSRSNGTGRAVSCGSRPAAVRWRPSALLKIAAVGGVDGDREADQAVAAHGGRRERDLVVAVEGREPPHEPRSDPRRRASLSS